MSFIIFDTEYTSWQGCQQNGWRGNRKKEIVQIAALKISDTLDVLEQFNVLCKPTINPVLSDYFTNLTHITNEMINKNGKSFSQAYKEFEDFVGTNICYSHAWGADFLNESDGAVIKENLHLYGLQPNKNITYRNIAPVFAQLYEKNHIVVQSQSSGQIVSVLGIKQKLDNLGLDTHNAFYDVYSILEGLKYFYPESLRFLKNK